ncbi:MAG: glutathione peroxidase [Alphaproteobacteria bacterium]|nr:glutathione peroxidase [Alphaproteobacteria bacterium]
MASIYDFTARDIDGNERSLGEYRGKLLLIVNTASQCGFTYQYKGLEELHRKYAAQGVEVLGFPCNQFGKQEPGDANEIKNFCSLTYDVTFPMFAKIDVNGPKAHPLYDYLTGEKGGGLLGRGIKWNFTKFLIDRDGKVIGRYAPTVKPEALDKVIQRKM